LTPEKDSTSSSSISNALENFRNSLIDSFKVLGVPYAPKLFGEPATAWPPPVATFMTARPRSLVPSARETKQPVDAGKAGWIGQDFG
jgi:hypothetical protein